MSAWSHSAGWPAAAEAIALLEPYRAGERLDIPVELNLAVARR